MFLLQLVHISALHILHQGALLHHFHIGSTPADQRHLWESEATAPAVKGLWMLMRGSRLRQA